MKVTIMKKEGTVTMSVADAQRLASPFRRTRDEACRDLRQILDIANEVPPCTCETHPTKHCNYCGH